MAHPRRLSERRRANCNTKRPTYLVPVPNLAGIVELDLRRSAQRLPALAEEGQDLVHSARVGQAQADGTVERILADPDVIALASALQIDRPDQIGLVQLVGLPGLGTGVLLAGEQRGQADPGCGQAVALEHTVDGAQAGQRTNVEGLEFGQDRAGTAQVVVVSRRGVGLQPPSDGEDGPFQLWRDAPGDVAAGAGEVVQAVDAEGEIAAPPFVEPGLGPA